MNSIGFFGLHAMTAGSYTSLIRGRTPPAQVDFDLLKNIATSAAFHADGKQKFGAQV